MALIANVIVPPKEWWDGSASVLGARLQQLIVEAKSRRPVNQSEWSTIWRQMYEVFANSSPEYMIANPTEYLNVLVTALSAPATLPTGTEGFEKVGIARPSFLWNNAPNFTRDSTIERMQGLVYQARRGEVVDRGDWNVTMRQIFQVMGDSNPAYVCSTDFMGDEYIGILALSLSAIIWGPDLDGTVGRHIDVTTGTNGKIVGPADVSMRFNISNIAGQRYSLLTSNSTASENWIGADNSVWRWDGSGAGINNVRVNGSAITSGEAFTFDQDILLEFHITVGAELGWFGEGFVNPSSCQGRVWGIRTSNGSQPDRIYPVIIEDPTQPTTTTIVDTSPGSVDNATLVGFPVGSEWTRFN